MVLLQQMNDLIGNLLRVQTCIHLNSHGIKIVHISYQLIHCRIRNVYSYRHAFICIADKGSIFLLCGYTCNAKAFRHIIAGNVKTHAHYIICTEQTSGIGIRDHTYRFGLFHFPFTEIISIFHVRIIYHFGVRSFCSYHKIKVSLSGNCFTVIAFSNTYPFHTFQITDCINVFRCDPFLFCDCIIADINVNLAASDITDL